MSMTSNTTYKQDRPEESVDCEMSPLVPMLTMNNLIKTQDNCSESDQSEVLIPLVAPTCKPSSAEVNTNSEHLPQNTEMPEESQSLLPQLPAVETCKHTAPPEECLSSSSCSQTVLDFPMLSQNNIEREVIKKDQPAKMVQVCKRYPQGSLHSASQKGLQSLLTGRIISNEVSGRPNQDNTQGGRRKSNNLNVQGNYSGKYTRPQYPELNSEWSQQDSQHTEIEDEGITFSQIPLSQNAPGETTDHLVCSQRELTPSLTDKVCSKIEGLAGSLDKLPRKQMLVTEATLLQCISQLQDRLHKQLKKEQNVHSNIDAYRRIIFTSQTGLSKVSERHRKDKQSLNQSEHNNTGRMAHLSQSQKISVHSQAVKDLARRQKKVLTLLKRQRCLVDSLKALKRSCLSGNENKSVTKTAGVTASVTKCLTETTNVTKKPGNLNLVGSGSTIHLSRSASTENGSKHSSQLSGINDQSHKRIHQIAQSNISEETHVKNRRQKAIESRSASIEPGPALQAMTSVDIDKTRSCESTQLDNVNNTTARLVLQAAQSVGLERDKPKACENEQNNVIDITADFSQRQSTQNLTQTSGVDLFADNDVDSVANTVSATGKANVGSDGVGEDDAENGGGMFTQDSDTGQVMNEPIIRLDDKIQTTTGNDQLEKSEFEAKSNQQTTSNKNIDLHEDSKNSEKDVANMKNKNFEESDDYDTQAPEAEKVEISEIDEKPEKSDKNAAEAICIDDGDDDDDDSIVIPESQNVNTTNFLKRKMDSDATNDENVAMKTKRTEQVEDRKGHQEKSAASSYSESLWLNMLKNDSEKTKSGDCTSRKYQSPSKPEWQKPNQVTTSSKLSSLQKDIEPEESDSKQVFIANKVSSVQPDFEAENESPVQSQSSSQMLAPVNAINFNVNIQKSYALDDINKNRTSISDVSDVCKPVVELSSPQNKQDVLDYGAVNDDYHSPKPCSPVSMAVRGSPCETLNNESPGGSTVYNFMSKTKQPYGREKSAGSDNRIKPGVNESCRSNLLPRQQNLNHSNQVNDNTKNSLLLKISENQNPQPLMGSIKFIQPKFQLVQPPGASNVISNGNVKQFIIMNNRPMNNVPMSNRPLTNIVTPAVTVTDTISDAINTVIQRSRETLADGDKDKNNSTKKQSSGPGMLPTLKELLQTGKLTPGKQVLSCNVKGVQQYATLTHFGKIRTSDGQTFNNVSAWLSTLYEGVAFKRRKSYETACYKGRPLLSYCKETEPTSHSMPTGVTDLHHTKTDSATQVDVSVFDKQSIPTSLMTEDEKRLSQLLSTSVVQILTNQDLVSNHDLPDNFWTEDFSKVTLTSDIWNCVTAW